MTHKQTRREFLANAARAATGLLVAGVGRPEPVEAEDIQAVPPDDRLWWGEGTVLTVHAFDCEWVYERLPSGLWALIYSGPPTVSTEPVDIRFGFTPT